MFGTQLYHNNELRSDLAKDSLCPRIKHKIRFPGAEMGAGTGFVKNQSQRGRRLWQNLVILLFIKSSKETFL